MSLAKKTIAVEIHQLSQDDITTFAAYYECPDQSCPVEFHLLGTISEEFAFPGGLALFQKFATDLVELKSQAILREHQKSTN